MQAATLIPTFPPKVVDSSKSVILSSLHRTNKQINMKLSMFSVPLALLTATSCADEFPNPCKRSDMASSAVTPIRAVGYGGSRQVGSMFAALLVSCCPPWLFLFPTRSSLDEGQHSLFSNVQGDFYRERFVESDMSQASRARSMRCVIASFRRLWKMNVALSSMAIMGMEQSNGNTTARITRST